jgi:hypothetical protein
MAQVEEEVSLQEVLESIMKRITNIECALGYIIKEFNVKAPDEAGVDKEEQSEQV